MSAHEAITLAVFTFFVSFTAGFFAGAIFAITSDRHNTDKHKPRDPADWWKG